MQIKSSFITKKDIIIIALILALALILLGVFYAISKQSEGAIAKIYVGDEEYKSIPLAHIKQSEIITIKAKLRVSIEVSTQGIRFLKSQCPDKICVNSGLLNKPHQSAACLPASVVVLIE